MYIYVSLPEGNCGFVMLFWFSGHIAEKNEYFFIDERCSGLKVYSFFLHIPFGNPTQLLKIAIYLVENHPLNMVIFHSSGSLSESGSPVD